MLTKLKIGLYQVLWDCHFMVNFNQGYNVLQSTPYSPTLFENWSKTHKKNQKELILVVCSITEIHWKSKKFRTKLQKDIFFFNLKMKIIVDNRKRTNSELVRDRVDH